MTERVILKCVLRVQTAYMKSTVSSSPWLFSAWTAAWRWTFGSLSNASCALENQEWPVHTATYLPKWSWRLINTCNPFLCRVSKWDFKSCAKPQASHCVWDSSSGERDFLSKSPRSWCYFYASDSTCDVLLKPHVPLNHEVALLTAYSPTVTVSHILSLHSLAE